MRYMDCNVGNIDYSPYRPALNPAFVRRVQERRRRQAIAEAEAEAARERRAVNAKKSAKEAAERRAARQGFCKLMRKHGAPTWVLDLVLDVAERHSVCPSEIAGKTARSTKRVLMARNEALYTIKERKPDLSFPRIAKWFDRDHTGVMHSIARHAAVNGLPSLCGYTIARRKLKSLAAIRTPSTGEEQ